MPVIGCALAGAANPTAKANSTIVFLKEILPFARAATARSLPGSQAAKRFDDALPFPGFVLQCVDGIGHFCGSLLELLAQ
jgi:hypothetical protein